MLRVGICDDDVVLSSSVEKMILDYSKSSFVDIEIEVFSSGEELLDFIIKEHSFDLILLDIEIGTTTGIEIGMKIRNEFDDHISKIVFISSKSGYEKQLFNIQPLNFLYKPIDESDLFSCISLAIKLVSNENIYFSYKSNYEIKKIQIKEILYFESTHKKMKIVTAKGEDYFYDVFENIIKKLPKYFFMPHRSYLVNYNNVKSITSKEIVVEGVSETIPLSKRNVKAVAELQMLLEREL